MRLRKVMDEVASINQFTFIQGRQLVDCAFIANELVDTMKKNGNGGIIFKIDFEKTFDIIAWIFLHPVMKSKGFSDKWHM